MSSSLKQSGLWILPITACLLAILNGPGCANSQHATGDTSFARTAAGIVVQVKLDEYRIHMPTSIPAGHVIFRVSNTGSHEHSIRVEGEGVDVQLPQNLKPGQSHELVTDLRPGKYKVTCPVGPHTMLGMKLDLTVTG
ncbi:MAG: cupredoxin domain-containing protein [Phycisphaerales bacterium]|nr:cupredoxin domain-containing protein [Phycisphaerales bacterium]MCI0630945.1 cupredoxin domain-containing protein [Phycisphaerales bacterium]MCI0675062.1 cupredoxin domain-containing protein [Phycisphaerales bacterium]